MMKVNGVIKWADFGLAEDMYGTKYYRRSKSESEERVSIRWMAPESIETNIYNEATAVVSLLGNLPFLDLGSTVGTLNTEM